jgi:quinol monooxygenase YgiN
MNQPPIYVFAKWQVKEDQLATVLSLLTDVAEKSNEEKGNLFYKIHQSNSNPNTLILFESYTDDSALEQHRNSEHFQNIVIGQIVPRLENREVVLVSELVPNSKY